MCKMRVVVLREMLGNRETGWTLWDGKQVMEMTSKQIKDTIAKGSKVCGLTIGSDGELVRDETGFACSNIISAVIILFLDIPFIPSLIEKAKNSSLSYSYDITESTS